MADLEKLVEIVFQGRDNVSQTMRSLDRRFDNFSQNVQNATEPLANFGRKAAMVEGILIAGLGAGLVYGYDKANDKDEYGQVPHECKHHGKFICVWSNRIACCEGIIYIGEYPSD